jgi:hypothetical protein
LGREYNRIKILYRNVLAMARPPAPEAPTNVPLKKPTRNAEL